MRRVIRGGGLRRAVVVVLLTAAGLLATGGPAFAHSRLVGANPPSGALVTSTSHTTDLRTELTVGGMHCGNCVRHVQDALAEIPGVSASVDLDAAVATVTHPAAVPVQALLDAVDEAGYEAAVRGADPR